MIQHSRLPVDGGWWRGLHFCVLAAALSTVFFFAGERSQFYRSTNHDYYTAKNLAIAENLSAQHGFRLFKRIYPGPNGAPQYEAYSRFPVTAHLLVKLAVAPAGDDLRAKVYFGRMLMLTLFCGAAMLLYHSLTRLLGDPTVALVATLLAFSSQYMLYYADMVSTENGIDCFGLMLAFHGIVTFAVRGRLPQLLAKTGGALLLGWHVLGLLLPFVVLGAVRDVVRAERARRAALVWRPRWRVFAAALAGSRYLATGLFALLFAGAVLGVNLVGEYTALAESGLRVSDVPSIRSLLQKVGVVDAEGFYEPMRDALAWPAFLLTQLHRVGVAVLPSFLSAPLCSVDSLAAHNPLLVAVGVGATAICAVGLVCLWRGQGTWRLVLPLSALAFSGFCWAVPMRRTTASFSHEHEGMFHIGIAAVLVALAALALQVSRDRHTRAVRVRAFAAAAAIIVFAASTIRMGAEGSAWSRYQEEVFADFQAIREKTLDATVFVVATGSPRRYLGSRLAMEFFLAGRIWQYSDRREESYREVLLGEDGSVWQSPPWDGPGAPDFIVARDRFDIPALLTPDNGTAFLYDSLPRLADAYRRMPVLLTAPVARAVFSVHLLRRTPHGRKPNAAIHRWRSARRQHELAYFKEPCVEDDFEERFFVHVLPVADEDLPDRWREVGFEGLDFPFLAHGVRLAGMCVATLPLPDYAIDRIRTGQLRAASGERSWEVEFSVDSVDRVRAHPAGRGPDRQPQAVVEAATNATEA